MISFKTISSRVVRVVKKMDIFSFWCQFSRLNHFNLFESCFLLRMFNYDNNFYQWHCQLHSIPLPNFWQLSITQPSKIPENPLRMFIWMKRVYLISPDSLWNSTTVSTLVCNLQFRLGKWALHASCFALYYLFISICVLTYWSYLSLF